MQLFTRLFFELDGTTRTADKLAALERYFALAPPADAGWGLWFLVGRKIKRAIKTRLLREWAAAEADLPAWLIDESYDAVGDLAETLALVLPEAGEASEIPLHQLVEQRLVPLVDLPPASQREMMVRTWRELDRFERLVWHKLIMGEFRVGVARTLVARALAEVAGVEPAEMSHRLMGHWRPTSADYQGLLRGGGQDFSRPYPFFLAHPLEDDPRTLGDLAHWQAEWKWDGVRAQLIHRDDVTIWSRGEELVTDRFPEIVETGRLLPKGTVLDGEILCWRDGVPLPFARLQRRIGRLSVGARLLAESPAVFMAFDLLEHGGQDVRALPLASRRPLLESVVGPVVPADEIAEVADVHRPLFDGLGGQRAGGAALRLSPLIEPAGWDELAELREQARARGVEGLLLKRRTAPYGVGRPRGPWWKWKITPLTIDAVLIYAQRGHGRRASLYTDYTFGLWHEGRLVPVAKAYSGLTDAEIREVDRFVRRNTIDRFGPVRVVRPELVFELHFDGIQVSQRHKAGLAVRFPRMARWRLDKQAAEADTLGALRALASATAGMTRRGDD